MHTTFASQPVYIYTGGQPVDLQLPVALFIHGAGHDHSVWNHQAHHLTQHGYTVLVPDHPGHGASGGPPLASIEALSDWFIGLLDHLNINHVALIGHSMGSLVALHLAAHHPGRVTRLILLGSIAPMRVAQTLLDAARNNRPAAHAMINQWSYAPTAQLEANTSPDTSLPDLNLRLLESQADGVLASDLGACNAYTGGLDAASRMRCPVAMLCGEHDQMTPMRAAAPLHEALAAAPGGVRIITIAGSGHAMMAESPDAVTNAIWEFLNSE